MLARIHITLLLLLACTLASQAQVVLESQYLTGKTNDPLLSFGPVNVPTTGNSRGIIMIIGAEYRDTNEVTSLTYGGFNFRKVLQTRARRLPPRNWRENSLEVWFLPEDSLAAAANDSIEATYADHTPKTNRGITWSILAFSGVSQTTPVTPICSYGEYPSVMAACADSVLLVSGTTILIASSISNSSSNPTTPPMASYTTLVDDNTYGAYTNIISREIDTTRKEFPVTNIEGGGARFAWLLISINDSTAGVTLPLRLVSVVARHEGGHVVVGGLLQAEPEDYTRLIVQGSTDAQQWRALKQKMYDGPDYGTLPFGFDSLDASYTYFRVMAISSDGEVSTSPALHASGMRERRVSVYPNPARNGRELHFEGFPEHQPSTVSIHDLLGRNIRSINLPAGENTILIEGLSEGLYSVRVLAGGQEYTTLIAIQD